MDDVGFLLREDEAGRLLSLSHPEDEHRMNWVEGRTPWGSVTVPEWPKAYHGWGESVNPYRLDIRVDRQMTKQGRLRETYTFTNHTDFEIYTQPGEVSICTPFNDRYDAAEICKHQRCNAHIWCGGMVSYVMALRMGGDPAHLGLVLTEGALESYSVLRDDSRVGNDRGDFLLHPEAMHFYPGQSHAIAWELFWFDTTEAFFAILSGYPHFIHITAEQYVLFSGETLRVQSSAEPSLVEEAVVQQGERTICFRNASATTVARAMVLPSFEVLLTERVRFIAGKQQCDDEQSGLYGAYLIYDNACGRQYYSHVHDHNAGRERVGMGVLIARYLRTHLDRALDESLSRYTDYVLRELFDPDTGTVYNDYGRSNDWERMYNYAWMQQFFLELYHLRGKKEYILYAANVVKRFYAIGGLEFYPIGLEVEELSDCLRAEGMEAERDTILRTFFQHVEVLVRNGTNYPAHEIKFEQSIIAPAANLMMQAYALSQDLSYLQEAQAHLKLLHLFNGVQPDYHMNEVAIRHWDGYWFGKTRLLGDTLPHYWSCLSGHVFARHAALSGAREDALCAERALRGPLTLFKPDGSASCAMIYPRTVNGQQAHCFDAWANDQDWALYYYLRWHDGLEGHIAHDA